MNFSQRIEAEKAVVARKQLLDPEYISRLEIKYSKPLSKSSDYARTGQTLFFPQEISPENGTVQELSIDSGVTFDAFLVAEGDNDGAMKYLTFSKLSRSATDIDGNEITPITLMEEYNKSQTKKTDKIKEENLVYTLWNKVLIPELIFQELQGRKIKWLDTKEVVCINNSTKEQYVSEVNLIAFVD